MTSKSYDPSSSVIPGAVDDPLLRVSQAAAILQISVPTFWRRVADGTIPKPIKLGALSRWPRSEILHVIEAAKERRGASLAFCGGSSASR